MEPAKRFWSRDRFKAVLWTTLPGVLGSLIGLFLALNPAYRHFSLFQFWVGARTGFLLGSVVAVFAFVFPGAEDKFQRWKRWGFASLVIGLVGGAVVSMLWNQGALHPAPIH